MTDASWILFGILALLSVAAIIVVVVRALRGSPVGSRAAGPRPAAAEPARAEARRQKAVDDLKILDTPREDRFDRIVTMARQLYGTESAVFSVIDRDREWHKSRSGNTVEVAERTASFCSVTIRGADTLIVGDASKDDRFSGTAGVIGDPNLRFYAGYPVRAPGGEQIGALCVYDPTPRDAGAIDDSMLRQLAHLLEAELRVASPSPWPSGDVQQLHRQRGQTLDMATKRSRKLKKADKALAAATKVLAKAEKKRDSVLAREKAKLDKKLDRRAKDVKRKRSAKSAKPTAAAAAPKTSPAPKATPAAKPAPVAKAAPAATAAPAPAKAAFTTTNTVAELREAAKANSIAGYSSMTKAQLLAALV